LNFQNLFRDNRVIWQVGVYIIYTIIWTPSEIVMESLAIKTNTTAKVQLDICDGLYCKVQFVALGPNVELRGQNSSFVFEFGASMRGAYCHM